MVQFGFGRELRLLTPSDFSAVFSNPVSASSAQLTLLAVPNYKHHPRVGFALSKKNIKRATQRNRIKRIVRNSFRLYQHKLPSVDIVVIGKKGLDKLNNDDLLNLIQTLWQKLLRRCKS